MSRAVVDVVLYSRAGCGLCARAERIVAREAARARVAVIDVDAEPSLSEAFGVRVPVVVVDGIEVAELELAPGVVRRAVRAARRGALGPAPPRA